MSILQSRRQRVVQAGTRIDSVANSGNSATVNASLPTGHLFGMTMTNGTDAVNDINFAAGLCRDSTDAVNIIASALVKQLDATWAVGTNAGGRMSAAAIANTTYHCFAIYRSDTGVVDYGFDTSATAPTLPTGYTHFRRIGSIIRAGATILAFSQVDDEFLLTDPVNDVAVVNLGAASVSYTLTTPAGIKVIALLSGYFTNATVSKVGYIRSLDQTDAAAAIPYYTVQNAVAAKSDTWTLNVRTNTSSQIAARADTAGSTFGVMTRGWLDTRGRLS